MAAVVGLRHNPVMQKFCKYLIAASKPAKVVWNACVHKLLIILNAMVKIGQKWDSIDRRIMLLNTKQLVPEKQIHR
jgi:transposase